MITTADLKTHTKSDLARMAKRLGVAGCSAMLKGELVAAVAKASRAELNGKGTRKAKATATSTKSSAKRNGATKNGVAAPGKSRISAKAKKHDGAPVATKRKVAGKSNRTAATRKKAKPGVVSPKSKPVSKPAKRPSLKQPTASPKQPSAKRVVSKAVPKKLVGTRKKVAPKPNPTNPRVLKRIRELQLQRETSKDISFKPTQVKPPGASEPIWEREPQKDRVALFVRDAYWLQASWDITRQAIERAKAAMAEQWHGAVPVLRLVRLDDAGTTNVAETVQRDIEIHGGLRNWYIEWTGQRANFRVMVGFRSTAGRFHSICESNTVTTPTAGASDAIDDHWGGLSEQGERIYALSGGYDSEKETRELKEVLEDRLHRSLGAPALARLGVAAGSPLRRNRDFHFDMDIELVFYGSTVPDGYLTLNGEPVALREDGTFVLRLPFADRRQVLPAVACSRDGSQQRTIVVAVERNTKVMQPLAQETNVNS